MAVKDKEGLLFAALYDGEDNRVFTASRTQATNAYQLFKRKPETKSPKTSPSGEAHSLFWYGFTQNVIQFFSSFASTGGYDWIGTFDTVSTAYHQKVAKDRATKEGLVVHPPSEDNLPGEDPVVYSSEVSDVLIPYTTKEDTYHYYETRNYVNDINREHSQVLQTYDDQLKKRESYIYGNGRSSYTNESTGDSYHYLTDRSGSVTGLSKDGEAVASSSHTLYGATEKTTDTTGNPFAYNGEARDVTGLDYLRARYYDSQAGSFLTADSYSGTLTNPLSQNLYTYVENNPANYTDPSGHSPFAMLEGGGRLRRTTTNTNQIKPRINLEDGTIYAPSTQEHKAHEIRQQQTHIYQHTYIPSTSYQYTQQQVTKPQETQYSRLDWARIKGHSTYDWGQSRLREAANIGRNWTKALEETLKHFCDPKTLKGKDSGSNRIDSSQLLAIAGISSATMLLLGMVPESKNKKSTPLFGMGSYTIESPSLEVPFNNGWYSTFIKTSNSTEKPSDAIFNLNITNGWQPSLNINIAGGSGTIGLSGDELVVSGSISSSKEDLKVTNTATATLGLGGVDYNITTTYTFNGIVTGHGTGISLNGDLRNGILGGYSISQAGNAQNGVTSITTTETGVRTIGGKPVGVAVVVAGIGYAALTLGQDSKTAYKLISLGISLLVEY